MKLKNIKANYTMVPNEWLRSGLSFKAIGLIALLQSLPDDWDFSIEGLATISKDGREAIRSALKELENAGFIKRQQAVEKGKFSHNIIELSVGGDTVVVKSDVGEDDTINKRLNNKEKQKKENKLSKDNLPEKGFSGDEEYGNAEINELFKVWEGAFGYQPKNNQKNRYAASNLLRNKNIGMQKAKGIIQVLPALQRREYCIGEIKRVSDFESLHRNWDYVWNAALTEWEKQQQQRQMKGAIKI